jgi:hypothetical protein
MSCVFLPHIPGVQALVRPASHPDAPRPRTCLQAAYHAGSWQEELQETPVFLKRSSKIPHAQSGGDAMTPEERKLILEPAGPDPDFEEHLKTYLMFTRLMKYCMFAAPFFFAFIFYWTV